MNLKFYLSIFFLVLCFSFVNGQEKKDSLYYKIEEFSDKRKVTKFIHRFIFRRELDSVSVKSTKQVHVDTAYSGRAIRNIDIVSIDPFGYKKGDERVRNNWYDWFTNHLHTNTRLSTINNYLLFKKGDKYNAQKLYESERLLRRMNFVNRVNINVNRETSTSDSIDISVRVLDSWSLKPSLNYSGNRFGIGVTEENFLGLGHEAEVLYSNDSKEKQDYLFASYTAYNLFSSFINARVLGERDYFKNERISLSISRPFFSTFTRFGGGLNMDYFMRRVLLPIENLKVFPEVQIKVYNQDLWLGYQFPLSDIAKGNTHENIAVMGRFFNYQYKDSPGIDINKFFRSYNAYLLSAEYVDRRFSVEKQIFQYDLPEDIPYGKTFGLTGGYLNRSDDKIPYFGASASYGSFINWGFFSFKAQFGRFFNEDEENNDAYRFDVSFFSRLKNYKIMKARHFLSTTYVLGSNENNYSYKDRINFSPATEFPVYSGDFIGTKKFIVRYQLQTYINKTWKNFHFSPYFITAFGWMAQNGEDIFHAKTNTKFGLGVLINNPYLVFNRIQISLMYYPKVPFENNSVFDFNGYRNSLLPLNSFNADIPHFVNFGN